MFRFGAWSLSRWWAQPIETDFRVIEEAVCRVRWSACPDELARAEQLLIPASPVSVRHERIRRGPQIRIEIAVVFGIDHRDVIDADRAQVIEVAIRWRRRAAVDSDLRV